MRTFRLIGMVVVAVMIGMSFSACDDEEDEPLAPSIEMPDDNGGNNDNNNNDDDGGASYQECPTCDGSGDCPGSHCDSGYCSSCGGVGYEYDGYTGIKMPCAWCERGKCPSCKGRNECPKCHGKGYIR